LKDNVGHRARLRGCAMVDETCEPQPH
jgi:hypothetical protein